MTWPWEGLGSLLHHRPKMVDSVSMNWEHHCYVTDWKWWIHGYVMWILFILTESTISNLWCCNDPSPSPNFSSTQSWDWANSQIAWNIYTIIKCWFACCQCVIQANTLIIMHLTAEDKCEHGTCNRCTYRFLYWPVSCWASWANLKGDGAARTLWVVEVRGSYIIWLHDYNIWYCTHSTYFTLHTARMRAHTHTHTHTTHTPIHYSCITSSGPTWGYATVLLEVYIETLIVLYYYQNNLLHT